MEPQNFFSRSAKQLLTTILPSPLHFLASGQTLLITVCGQKSGKSYTLPVNYSRQGDVVTILSRRSRVWWRNLRGGSPVTLWLKGKEVVGWGTAIEEEQQLQAALSAYVATLSRVPRRFQDIEEAARTRVMIQVKLGPHK